MGGCATRPATGAAKKARNTIPRLPRESDLSPGAHPETVERWKQTNGPEPAIGLGEKHNDDKLNGCPPVASVLTEHKNVAEQLKKAVACTTTLTQVARLSVCVQKRLCHD